MTAKEVEDCTILRGVVGSTIYGINMGDGTEDRDEMGVCIEPAEQAMALSGEFEQFIYRTAVVRTGDNNARSVAGDLDLTVYSLRKYLRLALKGNPTIIGLLFNPNPLVQTTVGQELIALRSLIISKRAGYAFLGYMQAQRERMMGTRGGRHGVRHRHPGQGYDTKYAMHLLRLGLEGIELVETGKITLPMIEEHRNLLLAVRRGEVDQDLVLAQAKGYETTLKNLLDTSDALPDQPNVSIVEKWMVRQYLEKWNA